jgi:hypothetical protein
MEVRTPLALCVPSTPAGIGDLTIVSILVGDAANMHAGVAEDGDGDGRAMVTMPTSL